jgi:hypothetical protein
MQENINRLLNLQTSLLMLTCSQNVLLAFITWYNRDDNGDNDDTITNNNETITVVIIINKFTSLELAFKMGPCHKV